jgi:hypothetical protein
LQLSVPQVPLFLHPFGAPPSEVEQLVQAIVWRYICRSRRYSNEATYHKR